MGQNDNALQLAQTSNMSPQEILQNGIEMSGLKDIYTTQFVIFNTAWSVVDWTILVIIVVIIIVGIVVGLIFCCCIGSDQETVDKDAREKAEEEAKNKDYMEYMQGEQSLVAGLGAGEAAEADADKKE